MNPVKIFCLMACLVATTCATPSKHQTSTKNLKPTDWLSTSELESLSSLNEVTLQQLEDMPVKKGAELVKKLYHLSQINNDIVPTFVPSASNIPCYLIKPNGQNESMHLNELAATCKQQDKFGEEEVTIFITGLPPQTKSIRKATWKLVQAYEKRYFGRQQQQNQQQQQHNKKSGQSSSEEDSSESWSQSRNVRGNLVVIDLGATLNSFERFAMLDVEKTGDMIGKILVHLTNEANVPQEIVHIVAQGIAAHVAGAACRQYVRLTGHKLRRITALDPAKVFAKNPHTLTGLARGDAHFVDAIHSCSNGMGMTARCGDVDFFPNGPIANAPGAENVIKASMRATLYYAESVIPGNERNFPAVPARCMADYNDNNGYGRRAYMGIDTDFDVKGDYMLQTNANAPFGKNEPAHKQNAYHHGMHQSWRKSQSNSQENE